MTAIETQNTIQNRVNVIVVVWVSQTLRADGLQACQPPVDCIHQLHNFAVSKHTAKLNRTEYPYRHFPNTKLTYLYYTIISTVQNIMCVVLMTFRLLNQLLSADNRLLLHRDSASFIFMPVKYF